LKRHDVVVVGAGIVGLSTTLALLDRGIDVRCIDSGLPGSAQSQGRTRIFRIAHRTAGLAGDALVARELWAVWAARAQRRLIGAEGLLLVGEETASARARVLREVGAPYEVITAHQVEARLPGYRTSEPALLDHAAGAIRARRTIEWLSECAGAALVRGLVRGLEPAADEVVVHLEDGDVAGRRVIVCAGTSTAALVAAHGVDVAMGERAHHRVTVACAHIGQPALVDDVTYSVPVGGRLERAVGLSGDADSLADDGPGAAAERLRLWASRSWPELAVNPIEVLTCVTLTAPWLDGGDGFVIRRSGPLIAFNGANVFKFAPLIGSRLADALS
jgi:sarcosine oxidase